MLTPVAFGAEYGQGWDQIGYLLLAFVLSAVIGTERQFHGKSAGLRTQTIVGTASAALMLVSKYGFGDVLAQNTVMLDPSRVASQIVSGIGFLGAGLIITRHGAIRGLTTAASVWETAAVGMVAGAGLPVLALVVTGLHFVTVLAFTPLGRVVTAHGRSEREYVITYEDGRGVLRDLLELCTARSWTVKSLAMLGSSGGSRRADSDTEGGLVTIELTLTGRKIIEATTALGGVDGVIRVDSGADDE